MEQVWSIMGKHLNFLSHAFGIKIFQFVLMQNHFHLLVRAPNGNLSEGMSYFMRETSRELARTSRRLNSTYGGRFFRSEIRSLHYFLTAYKYLYRNPVEAGLCVNVEDYRWSTLYGLFGYEHLIVPVVEDLTLFSDVEGTLRWLNQNPLSKDWQSVKSALRRRTFKLRKDRNSRVPNSLEDRLF